MNTQELNEIRLKKQLDKKWGFSEGVMTMREFVQKYAIAKHQHTRNTTMKRVCLEYKEINPKTEYMVQVKKGTFVEIPKLVYDSLNLPVV